MARNPTFFTRLIYGSSELSLWLTDGFLVTFLEGGGGEHHMWRGHSHVGVTHVWRSGTFTCGSYSHVWDEPPKWNTSLLDFSGDDKSWSTLIYNFTQDTTFHGVRYITAETPYISRRYVSQSVTSPPKLPTSLDGMYHRALHHRRDTLHL